MLRIDLTARKALVTGVTSGIGAAIARVLARAGCDVAGCGRSPRESEGAQQFLTTVTLAGRRARYTPVDLTIAEHLSCWVEESAQALGGIDILVSNAGRNIFTGVLETNEKTWQECMDLDLSAHWRLAQAAYPFLAHSLNPVVLIISSNHAFATIPGCFPYNVAKAGLGALVQSLAIEWGPRVRSVGIAPGFIDTPGNDTWFNSFPDPAARRAEVEHMNPVGRIGTAEEIGALCAFLASSWSGFISGTTILVDGGRSALLQES